MFSNLLEDERTEDVSLGSDKSPLNNMLKNIHHLNLDDEEEEEEGSEVGIPSNTRDSLIDRESPYRRKSPSLDENNNHLNNEESVDESDNLMANIHFADLEISEEVINDDDNNKGNRSDLLSSADVITMESSATTCSFNPADFKCSSPKHNTQSKSQLNTVTIEEVDDVESDIQSMQSNYTDFVSQVSEHISVNTHEVSEQSGSHRDFKSQSHTSKSSRCSRSDHSSQKTNSSFTQTSKYKDGSRVGDTESLISDVSYTSDTHSVQSKSKYLVSTTKRSYSNSERNLKENEVVKKREKGKMKGKGSGKTETKSSIIDEDKTDDVLNFRHDWQLGRSKIATNIVGSDILDILTNYNPSVLAANDLMKYHLRLLRQQIDHSRRLYEAYANDGISAHRCNSYKYTTIEDTKRFLKENSPKVISFEEALRQVKKEEGDR